MCGFETEMNVQFVSHMSLHVDKEQWMFSICCTACDFVTMEESEMKAHVTTKHAGNNNLCLSLCFLLLHHSHSSLNFSTDILADANSAGHQVGKILLLQTLLKWPKLVLGHACVVC